MGAQTQTGASVSTIEPLVSLDRSTLRERALSALRTAITSGRYRPGDHLGEVELANGLGISRGTVREALRHLEQEGLVEAGPRGRLRVNSLNADEIRGLYQVRAALEGLAATTIIRSPRRIEAVASLRAALDELSGESAEFTERVEADLAFHLLLCQLASNPMLVESWKHLEGRDRKSTRLNSSHVRISYAVFCLKKKKNRATRAGARARRTQCCPRRIRHGPA